MDSKPNSGRVFSNVKGNENAPDYTGRINVNGEEFRIAMWENFKSENGHAEFSHFNVAITKPLQSQSETSEEPSNEERKTYTKPTRRAVSA